jgi:hypothetical protein
MENSRSKHIESK